MNRHAPARSTLRLLVALALLSAAAPAAPAQKPEPHSGHTHDILAVKFAPDGRQLVSYSAADEKLILWDVATGRLVWMAKTGFVRKAEERANLHEFWWSEDRSWLVTKSANGTYQRWSLRTGRLESYAETPPEVALAKDPPRHVTAKLVDDDRFELHDAASGRSYQLEPYAPTGRAFDVSPDGRLFAEGGRWGDAGVRITELATGASRVMTGREAKRTLPPYRPGPLEARLLEEARARRRSLDAMREERARRASVETKRFARRVTVTFDHYGAMGDPGQKRMMESSEPKESAAVLAEKEANAVWLRLGNASPLPILVPTPSAYLPDAGCFFVASNGEKVRGLCDGREIAVWFGLEDRRGRAIPYGFDFGSSAVLLPGTSALFAVPREVLRNGNAVRFSYTFLEAGVGAGGRNVEAYGEPVAVRVRESDARPAKE